MRFELPERKKLTHEMVVPIRWGDMDAMGHVNNTVYFRYMEVVRLEWLFKIGGAPDPSGIGPVIVNAFCNFIRQLEFPGDVLARHYVANPGRSSFDTFITLERVDAPGIVHFAFMHLNDKELIEESIRLFSQFFSAADLAEIVSAMRQVNEADGDLAEQERTFADRVAKAWGDRG